MKETAIILVVLVSGSTCQHDNISHAKATFSQMPNEQTCLNAAQTITKQQSIKAFCIKNSDGLIESIQSNSDKVSQ